MSKSDLRVGFATAADVNDHRAWSGTLANMYGALLEQFTVVESLGPLRSPVSSKLARLADKAMRVLAGGGFNYLHTHKRSRFMAEQLTKRIRESQCDVIFAPAASTEIAHLNTDVPICYLSDTSFDQITEYYKKYSKFSASAHEEGSAIERLAIQNSGAMVYPSAWAADFVVEKYGASPEQVFVEPFGANMADEPAREEVLPKSTEQPWRLLFLGVCWERKGGAIALEALESLLEMGFEVEMTVCGCVPPVSHPKMKVIPFVDKKSPEGYAQFKKLLQDAHVLLLPTRAEAFGVVFCEASAYAVPSVTTATGGTGGAVTEGVNGYALPLEANGAEYAKVIADLFESPEKYHQLSESSRIRYEEALSWRSWGKSMRGIMEKLSEKSARG